MYNESGIYKIVNRTDNKYYIGSSINLLKRRNRHFSELRLNKHFNTHLQNAFNKYGERNFSFEILIYCSKNDLELYEQLLIDKFKPAYNLRNIANSNYGIKRSEDYKQNVGNFFRGKHISNDHKDLIRIANIFKKPARSKSGYKGVYPLNSGKYRSRVYLFGKVVHLGVFSTPQEAYEARINFLNSNFPDKGGYTYL